MIRVGVEALIQLFQAEILASAIEHQCLTRRETNCQHGLRIFMLGLGNTVDKSVVFKHSRLYCREIIPCRTNSIHKLTKF